MKKSNQRSIRKLAALLALTLVLTLAAPIEALAAAGEEGEAQAVMQIAAAGTDLSTVDVEVQGIENKRCTGKEVTQDITVIVKGKVLTEGVDYKVSYENNVDAGAATIKITGMGKYTGTVKRTFKLTSRTSTRRTISCIDITFKRGVLYDAPLKPNNNAGNLTVKGQRKSIKLNWTKAANLTGIDGYIIVRRINKQSRWYQIATVNKNATTYTDKTASKKNTFYQYSILGYKNEGKYMRVTPGATFWAGAVTTKSTKKNVYSVSVTNPAAVSALRKGTSATAETSVTKNGYNKGIRWRSSNTDVATVNSKGLISAKKAGTTTITMRVATGKTSSFKVTVVNGGTARDMLTVMQTWVGFGTSGGKHKAIVDIYNSVKPLPVNYKVKYSDQWCDTCVTAAAIRAGVDGKTGRECGVQRHVDLFKKKGIWIENGKITPKPGDIIVFSWYVSKQPNNAEGCHIGIVESVKDGQITTIEGNFGNKVKRRTIPVGWGYIRGYARIK